MSLNAVYRASQFRQQSGHVARSGSDLEYTVLRLNIEMLKHQRHNKRLRDRLPLSDGDGMIRVSLRVILGGNKLVARHVRHGRQYSFIVDASALQLSFHHAMPLMGKSVVLGLEIRKHCRRNVSTGNQLRRSGYFRLCRRRISKLTTPFWSRTPRIDMLRVMLYSA